MLMYLFEGYFWIHPVYDQTEGECHSVYDQTEGEFHPVYNQTQGESYPVYDRTQGFGAVFSLL